MTHDPYAALRQRNYRHYALGWFTSVVGVAITDVAVGWEVFQRTREPFALALVGLVQALGMIAVLPAGHVADRFSRRTLLVASMIGVMVANVGLAVVSFTQADVWMMFALLLLSALSASLGRPARTAMLPRIVGRGAFPNAVTWNQSLFQVAVVVGPVAGGLVMAHHQPSAYLISAGCCALFIASLVLIRVDTRPDAAERPLPLIASLREGLTFLGRNRLLPVIMSLDMFAVLLGSAVILMPVFADEILHVGARGNGMLKAAPGAGALVTALWLAHRPPMRRAGWNLLIAVGVFGVATIAFGLSRAFWLSMLAMVVAGASDCVSVVIRHTLVQTLTPDSMRGRVSAVNHVFIGSSNELGAFRAGTVAGWFGPVFSVVSGGIGTLCVVVVTACASKQLRQLRDLHAREA